MKDFDSNRIYQILGDEFKNIYIVDCEDQQIHTFKETLELPGFSSCTSYNDAMNQYIDDRVYDKNRDMLRMALSFNSLFSRLEKTEHFNVHYQSKNNSEVHFMYSHFGRVMEDGRLKGKSSLVLRMKIWIFVETILICLIIHCLVMWSKEKY